MKAFYLFNEAGLKFVIWAGDLKLIAYKAACASHLYGKASEYFTKVNTYLEGHDDKTVLHFAKVNTYLEGHDDKTLLTFLHMHTRSSIGFYSKFIRK